MESKYPHLMSPITIRGHVYRNRIEFGPTLFAHAIFACPEIRENVYRMVEDRAKGGAGAVTTGEICLNYEEAKTSFADHVIDFKKYSGPEFEGLKEYADRIKKYGAVALFEVCHEGSEAPCEPDYTPYGPDEFVRRRGIQVKAFDEAMMQKVCDDFETFGAYAAAAGFDGVLVHGGHGFLFQQFVSPRTNHRTDEYGGSMENRARFPKRMLEALRRGLGEDKIIELRFSARDGVDEPGAMTVEDTAEFAKCIDGLVDIFHVSNGLKSKGNSTGTFSSPYDPHGLNQDFAAKIKAGLKKSYVAVIGGVNSPETAEEIIANGKADIVVFGRQGFADPEFAKKVAEGREDLIRPCLRCFACYPTSMEHPTDKNFEERGITREYLGKIMIPSAMGTCTVNPDSGFGRIPFDCQPPVKDKKKVLVIGGGPAGMQAAITAAARGHEVTLVEKNASLGGIPMVYAPKDPYKQDIVKFIGVLEKEARVCAEIRTGTEADAAFVKNFGADVTLIATGSKDSRPEDLEGKENLLDIREAYTDTPKGKKILVLGGGFSACETALYLREAGNEVRILYRGKYLIKKIFGGARNALLTKMEKAGVEISYETKYLKVLPGAVKCELADGTGADFEADLIYGALGSRSCDELYNELAGSGMQVIAIGDCAEPGRLREAIHTGYEAAVKIGV